MAHRYGIAINTSDNPAWNVIIDLAGTDLDGANMPEYEIDNGDDDWVQCRIVNNQFCGVGDPSKLVTLLKHFFQLVPKS
jgi:immunity protein 53 of polymorphic toxin system